MSLSRREMEDIKEGREEEEEEDVQADDDEDDEDEEDSSQERTSFNVNQTEKKDHQQRHHHHQQQQHQCEASADELEKLKKRRASLKRNHTDDSEVEQRMARIFHEINYSVTDSVDDLAKFNTSHSSAEAPAPPADSGAVSRVEVETQTTGDDEQQVNDSRTYESVTVKKFVF